MLRIALTAALFFAALPAEASDCRLPRVGQVVSYRFLDCLRDEIARLKRELADSERDQASLRRALAEAQRDLADVQRRLPGSFRNDNGVVSTSGGQTLVSATFTVESRRTGGSFGIALDRGVIETLCSRDEGCALSVLYRAKALRAAEPAEIRVTGPCAFFYSPVTGVWSRSSACGIGQLSGVDGDGAPTGPAGTEVIASAAEVCALADSDPRGQVGPEATPLGRDHARGLYLVAAPGLDPDISPDFSCTLTLE